MKHFHSGYILDIIADKISSFEKSKENSHDKELLKIKGLLAHVASFDVQFPSFHEHNLDLTNLNPFLATLNNVISRGLPTKAPLIVEEQISDLLKRTIRNGAKQSEIKFHEENYSISYEKIFELLHIVEPQLQITKEKYAGFNIESEWQFINQTLANYPFAKQILQPQRLFSTITDGMGGGKSVDFCFQSPYLHWNNTKEIIENISRIFEVDGIHHELWQYKIYDNFRDEVAANVGFETLRVPITEISKDNTAITELFDRSSFKVFEKNYKRKLETDYEEYILIFTPLAIGRIQKTLIELFLANENLLNQPTLKIAIIERDVPCGALAIENLTEYFDNLNSLLNDESKIDVPKIELTIYPDSRFEVFNSAYLNATTKDESEFENLKNSYDIILDHSILRRSKIYKETTFQCDKNILIRSSHYNSNSFGNARRTYCAKPLQYKTLVEKQNDGSFKARVETEKNINYFIQNIFRKVSYRDGQLPIISRALKQLPVIGLLPTGGGKSLTFQLSVLMQPGLCVVVDPIKSLMEDQVRVLKENWIDCCDYINSTLSREDKRNRLINFRYGETQILFVSPERFVMTDFRLAIQNINSFFGLAISYCVIDEVHCVSEWGHDFRDTYLFLGKNAQNFCGTKNRKRVSLIGLTATASFDVLADVERELKIEHSDIANAVIMIENTIRPEMFYRVITDNNPSHLAAFQNDFDKIGSNLQFWNNVELLQTSFKKHQEDYNKDEVYPQGGYAINNDTEIIDLSNMKSEKFPVIIFCASKSDFTIQATNSVCDIYSKLNSIPKGYYYGGEDDDTISDEIQNNFVKFTKGKLQHIVCTKAFGMGIDKADVRAVYHITYSNSLESFVQEAGRAGRDKKISESVVLYNNSSIFRINLNLFTKENYSANNFLQNISYRKAIRWDLLFPLDAITNQRKPLLTDTRAALENAIDTITFRFPPPAQISTQIKEFVKGNIIENKPDRAIHDYFYSNGFKGIDIEKSQIYDLFKNKEFPLHGNQTTLYNDFENSNDEYFSFSIASEKKYPNNVNEICRILRIVNPPQQTIKIIEENLEHSHNYFDFILGLEERNLITLPLSNTQEREIKFKYSRERGKEDTGKIIYRMSCIGLVDDYTIDYNNQKLRTCKLRKADSIEFYEKKMEEYFSRYLSEITTNEKIEELKNKFKDGNSLIDNILECLYFLTEFSYSQIADKRKRATNDIEQMLSKSIAYNDRVDQNNFIKDEIFYYFNAKYARPDYKIGNTLYSLLTDSDEGRKSSWEIVTKYTVDVLENDIGTPKNNYKHLIGSCRKITRAMASEELKKEWSLKLINAYSLYSVNTSSYISEANESLFSGFISFYYSKECKQNYQIFEAKYKQYFDSLIRTLDGNNTIFTNELQLIMHSIMIEINMLHTSKMISNHNELLTLHQ